MDAASTGPAPQLTHLQQAIRQRLTQAMHAGNRPLVLLSVSGGADSTFLLYLFHRMAHSLPVRLHVMHIDHRQRATSHRDACFVEAMCQDLDLPFHGYALAANELTTVHIRNRQAAMRSIRYRHLAAKALSLAEGDQIPIVVTGHHANDLAETLLMNLVRGTGIHGLRGIQEWQIRPVTDVQASLEPHRVIHLYRPLLTWNRQAIESTLTHWGVTWRDDPSNHDTRYSRNRIRQEVIPTLEALNPRFVLNLARRSQDWVAAIDGIQQLHEDNLARILVSTNPSTAIPRAVVWDLEQFQMLPAWQKTGFLHTVCRRMHLARTDISTARLENLVCALALVQRSGGPWPWFHNLAWSSWYRPDSRLLRQPLPRLLISVHHNDTLPFVWDHPVLPRRVSAWPQTIRFPQAEGTHILSTQHLVGNWTLNLREITDSFVPAELPTADQPWRVILDLDCLETSGTCLYLAPPDKQAFMQPLGMATGHKQLGRLLRDRRIHTSLHALWPVLYTADHKVVWVCGLHLDQRFALHAGTRRFVEIRWYRHTIAAKGPEPAMTEKNMICARTQLPD